MGDLAKAVAELELQLEEARELGAIAERLDTEIAANLDEIDSVGSAVREAHYELDNQIAEHNYAAVEESVNSVVGLIDPRTILPAVDAVLLLTAIRDDRALPSRAWPHAFDQEAEADNSPLLTQEQLDAQQATELANAAEDWEAHWGDTDWDESQRDDQWATDRAEHENDALRNVVRTAAGNIEKIIEGIGETVWPDLEKALGAGDRDGAIQHLLEALKAAQQLPTAYQLYEVNLSRLYTSSPGSLGAMGEHLMGVETWLTIRGQNGSDS
ncbi:hypothetical protein ABIA33_004006 [Streptacidiphilus sp. MAP12-16]|uniref:hypothetical protein n=1 Tax=Streptacidiphilus sp. MAP12-16 TaxID=3156300 RepID=UPI00351890CE